MEIFINECSLEEQYASPFDFEQSIRSFIKTLNFLVDINKEKKVYRSRFFFNSKAISGFHLGTTLKKNHSINNLYNVTIQRINPQTWQNEQIHDYESSYKFNRIEYKSTSVAEIAERQNINKDYIGCLLNFEASSFSEFNEIDILKNDETNISIYCFIDKNAIYNWLVEKEILVPQEKYDENSKFPPTDLQSIINNKALFDSTDYPKNQGRKIYRRKGTNELWVVDNMHIGKKAHCEVFDEKTQIHLGTSLYNEVKINDAGKDRMRRIYLG